MNIRKEYISRFFGKLTQEDKEKIYFENHMWHAFSYKKIQALEGKEAIQAFERVNKNDVYVFFQSKNKVIEKNKLDYNELINNIKNKRIWGADCYIVDKNFTWTFIITHETLLDVNDNINFNVDYNPYVIGPFFYDLYN